MGTKNKEKGIRLNLDLPTYGQNLHAKIRVNNEDKNIVFSLISLPMYLTDEIMNGELLIVNG